MTKEVLHDTNRSPEQQPNIMKTTQLLKRKTCYVKQS